MFGNVTDLPTLLSYAEALSHYEAITPIRGSKNLRPICDTHCGRRKKHMQIIKTTHPKALGAAAIPEGAIDAVACRLYNTDVITFVSNGDIIIDNGGYASSTTRSFITGILGYTYHAPAIHAFSKGGSTVIEVHPPKGKRRVKMQDEPIVIRRVDNIHGVAFDFTTGIPTQKGYYLKRAPMGMRRKEVEQFTKFALACAKMVNPEDYRRPWSGREPEAGQVYAAMADKERWNDALEFLLPKCVDTGNSWVTGKYQYHRDIKPKEVKHLIDEVLKYVFCDDLFEERVTNNPLSNDNGKYMVGAGAQLI